MHDFGASIRTHCAGVHVCAKVPIFEFFFEKFFVPSFDTLYCGSFEPSYLYVRAHRAFGPSEPQLFLTQQSPLLRFKPFTNDACLWSYEIQNLSSPPPNTPAVPVCLGWSG